MTETQDRLKALQEAIERKRQITSKSKQDNRPEPEPAIDVASSEPIPSPPAGERSVSGAEPNHAPIHIPDTKHIKGRSNKLDNGLTVKQEAFARLCAIGTNQSEAYRQVYDTQAAPETIHSTSSRLANEPKVKDRIVAIRTQIERDKQRVALRDRERWYKRAWAEAEGLDEQSAPVVTTPASRVAALGQLGKALRITENQLPDDEKRDAQTIAEDIANRLHALRTGQHFQIETDQSDDEV